MNAIGANIPPIITAPITGIPSRIFTSVPSTERIALLATIL